MPADISPRRLAAWRAALQDELAALQLQADSLRAAIADKRSKIEAIDRLLGETGGIDLAACAESDDALQEDITPAKAYWLPLLSALVELGGRARRRKVIEVVGQKMKDTLTQADHARLPSFGVRWEHVVAWQASHMRRVAGFLRNDSPRGLWEITDAGRQWLQQQGWGAACLPTLTFR